jgi:hypothetical protein
VDSSAPVFEIAARAALREALKNAGPVLLEPIMKIEVVTPDEHTGSVIGDLKSRRGQIQGREMRGSANVVNAMVPLSVVSLFRHSRMVVDQALLYLQCPRGFGDCRRAGGKSETRSRAR